MSLKVFQSLTTVKLTAEMNPKNFAIFKQEYFKRTRTEANEFATEQKNKWDTECRIYFNCPAWVIQSLEMLGFTINKNNKANSEKGKYPFRIDNVRLFWMLIEAGYRLGYNENETAVNETQLVGAA